VAEIVFRLISREMEKRRIIRKKELFEIAQSKSFEPRELSVEEHKQQDLISQKLAQKNRINFILLFTGFILSFLATVVSVLFLNLFENNSIIFFYAKEAYPVAVVISISTFWHLSKTTSKKNYT
jgi:hypothetical protein